MKAYYIAGTHWDREWYEPFQTFRSWLVDVIDGAMDLMDREPEFVCFHLDGQAVLLEDYLEVRPDQRERLVEHLKSGRLVAGPWYNLPDEWLISGESFIRNLSRGMRVCRELDVEPMNFGYTPDQFGHIAALPMIMTGFGIAAGIMWRGGSDRLHPAQFNWIGPDGSRMTTFRLQEAAGYAPFKYFFRQLMDGIKEEDELYEKHFKPYYESECDRAEMPLLMLLDAIDHDFARDDRLKAFNIVRDRMPELELVWGNLTDFGQEMLAHAEDLPEYEGEFRHPCERPKLGGAYLIVHTLSSRYPLKRRNAQCQALLEKWAEPYSLFQEMAGHTPVPAFLDKAWEYLLKNHPHDSICGCSGDQIHRDMAFRFDQSELLGQTVLNRAFSAMSDPKVLMEAPQHLVVHNPLPYKRSGLHEMTVWLPPDWPETYVDGLAHGEPLKKFALKKKDGSTVPFQVRWIERNRQVRLLTDSGRDALLSKQELYHLVVEMDLPAAGYTGLTAEPSEEALRNVRTLRTGPLRATNDLVTVEVDPDGTVSLTHENTGRRFDGLFLYEDTGDGGDGWTRGPIMGDTMLRTPGKRVTTGIEEDGALRTVFRVEREFDLPASLDWHNWRRSEERRTVRVLDRIYVEKGAPFVRVRTTISNTCKDHRFRVLFPTEVDAGMSFADSPFAVMERPIEAPEGSDGWHERWNQEKPCTTYCGVQDGQRGLALLMPFGPHEYEVIDDDDRTLALTLFRATGQTAGVGCEPDGQLLHDIEYEYLILPFGGEGFDPLLAARYVAEAQTGVKIHNAREAAADRTFIEQTEGNAIVTAMKPADDGEGGVIRLWNPAGEDVHETLRLCRPVKTLEVCNLNEETLREVPVVDKIEIPVEVPARGLATIRFTWA